MANQFVNLPVPVGNGVGAAVDVSTFGANKSVVIGGDAQAQITVEVNNDAGQAGSWAALKTVQNTGEFVINVACRWMRVRVSNYNSYAGGQAVVDVGGTTAGTSFQALVAPVGNGAAAAANTSALGLFKTVQVGGAYRGAVVVEVSEDGTEWGQPFAFGSQSPGIRSIVVAAEFMRVRRVGVPKIDPGLPIVNVAATDDTGGGGGGIDVEDDGVSIGPGPFTTLDFTGIGVTATDAGGGEATINIPGGVPTVEDEGVSIGAGPFTTFNFIGTPVAVTDAGGGQANVTITPGVDVQDEGVAIANNPHRTLNVIGPMVTAADAGGGVASVTVADAVIFDTLAGATNVRSNRTANQSAIDNTKAGIVNLGSKTGTVLPAATGATANYATIGGGDDNQCSADWATCPGGAGCKVTATYGMAVGFKSTVTGSGGFAFGGQCTAQGVVSMAGGNQCFASADYAVSLGSLNLSSGLQSCTIGLQCTASGASSFALGQSCTASNTAAFAMGLSCQATTTYAHARGLFAKASRVQDTFAAGCFDDVTAGQAQTSILVYRGTTPGVAATESVVLASSAGLVQTGPILEDNKAYAFVVTAVIGGVQAGPTRVSTTIILKFTAQRIAGVTTITGTGVGDQFGSAGGGVPTWTLVPTVGAGPDRLVLTFTTGATATAAKVVARIEMTEVAAF